MAMDLAFLVDITQEQNVLNKKLQDQGQLVSAAYDNVRAFSTKLVLWKALLSQTNLCHFPACKALMDSGEDSRERGLVSLAELRQDSLIPCQPPTHLATLTAPGCFGTRSTAQDLCQHGIPTGDIADVTYLQYEKSKLFK